MRSIAELPPSFIYRTLPESLSLPSWTVSQIQIELTRLSDHSRINEDMAVPFERLVNFTQSYHRDWLASLSKWLVLMDSVNFLSCTLGYLLIEYLEPIVSWIKESLLSTYHRLIRTDKNCKITQLTPTDSIVCGGETVMMARKKNCLPQVCLVKFTGLTWAASYIVRELTDSHEECHLVRQRESTKSLYWKEPKPFVHEFAGTRRHPISSPSMDLKTLATRQEVSTYAQPELAARDGVDGRDQFDNHCGPIVFV